jgi:hypothetical protein
VAHGQGCNSHSAETLTLCAKGLREVLASHPVICHVELTADLPSPANFGHSFT